MFDHYKYVVVVIAVTLATGLIAWGQRYDQAPRTAERKRDYMEEVRLRPYQDGYQAAVEGYGPTDGATKPPRYLRGLSQP